MAIINARMKQLRGPYADFDKSKALDGEFQVVTANDPNVPSGKAVYIAFAAGDVRRLVSIEDIEQMVADGKFKGDKGDKGDTGNGIEKIEFVSTSTATSKSTYKIIFTDGTSYTYSVNDGKSAYTYATEGGYKGSETQFYSDLGTLRNIVTSEAEREAAEQAREEAVMLGLRTSDGIDPSLCDSAAVDRLLSEGLLCRCGDSACGRDRIRIPEPEFFVSDSIIEALA